MGPEAISVSQINLYLTCSLKYRFQYIDRLPRLVQSASLVFGSAMHKALEWLHKERRNGRTPPLDEVLRVFEADWHAQLLDAEVQRLFRRLSVFAGGCTLQAIEAIGAALDDEAGRVFEGVASLLDQSLLRQTEQEGEESRLVMLETIREFGLEVLAESGEMEPIQQAHAAYYLSLAEEAEPELRGTQQVTGWSG